MPTAIATAAEFKRKVKDAHKDQLLILHSTTSNPARVNRFNIIALATALDAHKPLEVFTINIDKVRLEPADVAAYQLATNVITCTTVNEGVVMERATEPFETTLHRMVLNILR